MAIPNEKRETQKDSFLSSDLEEGCANVPEPLPEYPQTSTQLTAAILPPPSASAEEVRDYIRGVLVVKHGTTPGYAEEFAIKWQLGRGWDLRELGKQKFTQLFGELNGTHLCRDVKEEVNAQNNAKAQELIAAWEMTRKPRDYYNGNLVAIGAATLVLIFSQKRELISSCLHSPVPFD